MGFISFLVIREGSVVKAFPRVRDCIQNAEEAGVASPFPPCPESDSGLVSFVWLHDPTDVITESKSIVHATMIV